MRRLFVLSTVLVFSLILTGLGEENNPCLHTNTGLCGVPLVRPAGETLYLSVPLPAGGMPIDVRDVIHGAIRFGSQSLNCKICEESIGCAISIQNIVDDSGMFIVVDNGTKQTKQGTIYLRCNNHRVGDTYSRRNIRYTIDFEEDDGGGGGGGDHSHSWGPWSYDCQIASPPSDLYSTYNSSETSLRGFIKAEANARTEDESTRTKICGTCGKTRWERYHHTADWLCGYYSSPAYHTHNTETEMVPPIVNGKHLYCVRMNSSHCSGNFVTIPVWTQQTVASIEVTGASLYGGSGVVLPELPGSEPSPEATYVTRVYDPTKNNGVKLKAIANFGDWDPNLVSWEYYPHGPYDDRPYIYRPDPGKTGEIEFRATVPGTYVVVGRCNYGDDANLPAQAKAVTIVVVGASVTLQFPTSGDNTLSCRPCNPGAKLFLIQASLDGVDMLSGFDGNRKLKIEIEQPDDKELYEAYLVVRQPDNTIRQVPFPLKGSAGSNLLNVNGNWSGELLITPLRQAEDGASVEAYTVKAGFESSLLSDVSDRLSCQVVWDECSDGSCQTGTGGAGIRKGGRGKRVDGAVITARPSSVYGSFTLGKNASGEISGSVGFSTENLSLTCLSDSFKVQTVNGTVVGKDNNDRVIWTKNGKTASVIDYTETPVNGTPVLTGVRVRQFFSSDTAAGTAPAVPFSLVSDATFALSVNGSTAAEISVSNTTYNGALSQTESWNFSRPAALPSSWGLNYSGYQCWQENRSGVITVSGEKYETGGGITYRYSFNAVGTSAALAKVTSQVERLFPWGYGTISETDGNKTTTYTYHSGNYEQLASVRNPDGSRSSYTYDSDGNIASETRVSGALTTVTTYTRSGIGADRIRTVTAESAVGGTVISRRSDQELVGVSAESPDAPSTYTLTSVRYDGTDPISTVTTYTKRTDLHGRNVYSVTRRINPDGTENRSGYTVSGGTETTTSETGVFGNDTLTLGTRQISTVNRDGATLSSSSYFIDAANSVNVQTASTVNSNFDAYGRAQTTTYLDGSTVTRTYGCCGVATETDRDGVTTAYAYDDFKRISHTVRDGITTFYTYDALGNQISVTVKGRNDGEITTSKTYSNGELATATDALGNVTAYSRNYSTSGNDTTYTETVTNPDNSTEITVSVNGRQTGVSGTAVRAQTMTYGATWQKVMPQDQTVHTDMLGRNFKTVYADDTYSINYYNARSQVVKSVTPAGRVTLYAYDALGRQVTQAIDMNGNDEIDAADLVTSTAYGFGTQDGKTVSITTQTRSQGVNSAVISVKKQSVDGLESWQTDLHGLTTHTKLERLGSGNTRQTVTNPDGTKVITNSTNGRVMTVQNVNSDNTNGNLTTYTYDEFNRQIGAAETSGNTPVNTTAVTYNAAGNMLTQTVNGQTTSFVYDSMGRQTQITAPGGVVTNTTYYPTGDVQRIDGATYPVEYTYNNLGKQATMTTYKDANTPQVTSWTYNARGFMTQKTYADNSSVNYTYNADGQLLTRTWARGIVTTFTYDAAGRATGYSYSDGTTPAVSITLDFLDRQSGVTDAAGTRNFTYNAQQRLANETNPSILNGVIAYTYDNAGRRTGMNLNNGTNSFAQANYTYDVMGRIATVGNSADTMTYTYVPGTNMVGSAAWQNASINTVNTYDQYKRLTNIAVNNANVYGYTLNDKNQRTGATLPDGNTWAYTYDTLGQLSGAVKQDTANNPLANMSYLYDLIGNRTSTTENNAVTNYTSNLVNQYTLVNALVPTYDADGNMTSYNGWSYTWNGENRLTVAENTATGVRIEADYDYMGRRIFKKVYNNNVLTKHSVFAYDGFKQIAEFDVLNNNTLKVSYLWQPVGLDVPLLLNSEYLIADGNKNIIQLRNANGNVTDHYSYDPFGSVTHTGGSGNPFQFSSEFYDDETGLVYYNYRYYNPTLGRWTKRDPIEEEGGENLYAMVENNIINHWDFLGNKDRSYGARQQRQAGQSYVNQRHWQNPTPLNPYSGGTGMGGFADLLDMALSYRIKRNNINKINQARSACKERCKPGSCDYCCSILFRYLRPRYDLVNIISFSVTFYRGKCNNSNIYAYDPGISTTIENIQMKCQP